MFRWRRIAGRGLLVLLVLLVVGVTATTGWAPFVGPRFRPATDRRFDASPARLERGRYLVTSGIVGCAGCHSELKVGPDGGLTLVDGLVLAGRHWAQDGQPMLTAANLTSDTETGIGGWSDDELARAIREGVDRSGRALFPIMPYEKFRHLADEDLASVIVYLRSQLAVKRTLPKTQIPFPLNRLINGVPQPVTTTVSADLSTPVKRGAYLTTIGACADCHTPMDDRGTPVPGLDFAGGFQLHFDGIKDSWAANITPGVNGIPYYTEDLFLEVMKTGRVRGRDLSSIMPTGFYRQIRDEDLKDIFAYLQSLPAVDHYVDNAQAPTMCARCGLKHGGGERNKKRG